MSFKIYDTTNTNVYRTISRVYGDDDAVITPSYTNGFESFTDVKIITLDAPIHKKTIWNIIDLTSTNDDDYLFLLNNNLVNNATLGDKLYIVLSGENVTPNTFKTVLFGHGGDLVLRDENDTIYVYGLTIEVDGGVETITSPASRITLEFTFNGKVFFQN